MSALPLSLIKGALCAQVDPDLFFPDDGHLSHAAARVCSACHVRPECLTYALADPNLEGTWAATTKPQREQLRREAA